MRTVITIVLVGICVLASAAEIFPSTVGNVGVELKPHQDDQSRFVVIVTTDVPNFTMVIDHVMKEMGNLGTCSRDLRWRGKTSIRYRGKSLGMRSSVVFQSRICKPKLKMAIFPRVPASVEWKLLMTPTPLPLPLNELKITAEIENIEYLPYFIEKVLGLRIKESFSIPLPDKCGRCDCTQMFNKWIPELESVNFDGKGSDVQVRAVFTMPSRLHAVLACLR